MNTIKAFISGSKVIFSSIIGLAVLIILASSLSAGAFEYNQAPVIKVFCREDINCLSEKKSGSHVRYEGYMYDYLLEVGRCNNWLYEFDCGDPGKLGPREILESGRADLLACVSAEEGAKENLAVSKCISLKIPSALYVKQDDLNTLVTISDFAGKKIGIVKNNSANEDLLRYFAQNAIKPRLVILGSSGRLYDALLSGAVDGVFVTGMNVRDGCVPIMFFDERELHFAALPENAGLIKQIDAAVSDIENINPGFAGKLRDKYYTESFKQKVRFSDSELEYIKKKKYVIVGSGYTGYPFEFRGDTGQTYGIGTEVLGLLSEYTGLQFIPQKTYDYTDAIQGMRSGKIDVLPYVKKNFRQAERNRYHLTRTYLKIPLVMALNAGFSGTPKKIAVPASFSLPEIIKEDFPQSSILYFSTAEKCFEALSNKDVDAVFTNSHAAMHLLNFGKYAGINLTAYKDLYEEASLAVSDKADKRLLSVLNKGLMYIPESELNAVSSKYIFAKRKQGVRDFIEIYPLEAGFAAAILSAAAALLLAYMLFAKNREKKRIERLYYCDELTGETNYNYLLERAAGIIKTYPEKCYAAVLVNIVEFKFINDTAGYDAGNRILCGISKTLKKFIDPEHEVFARVYADRFAILLTFETNSELVRRIERLCTALERTNQMKVTEYPLIFNGGIYVINDINITVKKAFDYASFARKTLVAHSHKNTFAYYDSKVLSDIGEEKVIEGSMREALRSGHLVPYLQPKINCRTLETVGAEALVRWLDPVRGYITPDRFIPYFEKSGFITELDLYMFEQACVILRRWIDEGRSPVPISCNFSYKDISDSTLDRIMEILDKYGVPPELLEIEVTETVAADNLEMLSAYGERINRFGIKLCVDDFGAGYSSISLLQKMPVDVLKLDREFIECGIKKEFTADVLRGLIKTLQKHMVQIVCEGVETEDQRNFVSDLGCDIIQGYLYSAPLPVKEFEDKYMEIKDK